MYNTNMSNLWQTDRQPNISSEEEEKENLKDYKSSMSYNLSSSYNELELNIGQTNRKSEQLTFSNSQIPLSSEDYENAKTESRSSLREGYTYKEESKIQPTSIHDFKAIEVIGQGSYGRVILVRKVENTKACSKSNSDAGTLYALKTVKKETLK